MQQQNSVCDFSSSESWVVLSPIEQSIKKKIEAVGTPLRDWNINIYRGVLTGCNEAFIINIEKRDEILANCQTDDERTRTAELIRPIMSLASNSCPVKEISYSSLVERKTYYLCLPMVLMLFVSIVRRQRFLRILSKGYSFVFDILSYYMTLMRRE